MTRQSPFRSRRHCQSIWREEITVFPLHEAIAYSLGDQALPNLPVAREIATETQYDLYRLDIINGMHVISKPPLIEFWTKHTAAKDGLTLWHSALENCTATDFTTLKTTFSTADYVPPFTVFDVGGNNYRVVTVIHYEVKRAYIREVLTHKEYDAWTANYYKNKAKLKAKAKGKK